jgi:hypothetical protein
MVAVLLHKLCKPLVIGITMLYVLTAINSTDLISPIAGEV